jgi:hypothetical protein
VSLTQWKFRKTLEDCIENELNIIEKNSGNPLPAVEQVEHARRPNFHKIISAWVQQEDRGHGCSR